MALGIYLKITKKTTSTKLQKLTLTMPFIPEIQWAAYYTTLKQGYYKNEGLNVEMQYSNKGNTGAIEQLVAGKADIILTGEDGVIMARSKGLDVVSVYPIEPTNVYYILSEKSKNITKPADLIGKKIGLISSASGAYTNLLAILSLNNIDKNKVEIIQAGTSIVPAFLEKKFDVASVHLSQTLLIKEKMPDLNIIKASDYSDISRGHIAVMGKLIKNDPELIMKFLRATKKGLEYAVNHPNEAVDAYISFYPDAKSQRVESQNLWNAFIDVHHYKTSLPGLEKAQNFQKSQDVLFNTNIITKKTDVATMFTNKFIPK